MQIKEYGVKTNPGVLLIDNKDESLYRELSRQYHILCPCLSQEERKDLSKLHAISSYIRRNFQGNVYAVAVTAGNMEVARVILLEDGIRSKKIIIESREGKPGNLIAKILRE
ncbi:hypothetical protein [Anaerolentibacter hominis]|uniref:hypothetical protein n=1 Tax=Anaerolentibacter hominis TaxID=3079009 RepID=UPI0031B85C99